MRNKEQKGDLSVQAIARAHVVLLGMYLPEQKCPRWLGFALRQKTIPRERNIGCGDIRSSRTPSRLYIAGVLYSTRESKLRVMQPLPAFPEAQCIW
jgi:hypothetical protein